MAKEVVFEKYVAAGNDFIVFDNRKGFVKDGAKIAKKLCDRKFGVGADGILLLETSKKADVRMRIFNPDGSQAEMCGNGVRCLAHFAVAHKVAKPEHTVETGAGLIRAQVSGNIVKAKLTEPDGLKLNIPLQVNGHAEKIHFINTGVPHAVIVDEKLDTVDVESRGQAVRRHSHFAPKGTNVNFIRRTSSGIDVRTYERGVEGETLACGTGSTASALVASSLFGFASPVRVKTAGGETLKVYFKKNGPRFSEVLLEGPVTASFKGSVQL